MAFDYSLYKAYSEMYTAQNAKRGAFAESLAQSIQGGLQFWAIYQDRRDAREDREADRQLRRDEMSIRRQVSDLQSQQLQGQLNDEQVRRDREKAWYDDQTEANDRELDWYKATTGGKAPAGATKGFIRREARGRVEQPGMQELYPELAELVAESERTKIRQDKAARVSNMTSALLRTPTPGESALFNFAADALGFSPDLIVKGMESVRNSSFGSLFGDTFMRPAGSGSDSRPSSGRPPSQAELERRASAARLEQEREEQNFVDQSMTTGFEETGRSLHTRPMDSVLELADLENERYQAESEKRQAEFDLAETDRMRIRRENKVSELLTNTGGFRSVSNSAGRQNLVLVNRNGARVAFNTPVLLSNSGSTNLELGTSVEVTPLRMTENSDASAKALTKNELEQLQALRAAKKLGQDDRIALARLERKNRRAAPQSLIQYRVRYKDWLRNEMVELELDEGDLRRLGVSASSGDVRDARRNDEFFAPQQFNQGAPFYGR
jgi:hypothetical protein